MKSIKSILITLIIVACLFAVFSVVKRAYSNYKNLEKQNKALQQTMSGCVEKSRQLKSMQKTVVIAYGISEWEAKYYSYVFYDFSKHYKIPWEVFPAMVRVESNFRTTLRSPKDAKGLTQVLESTAIGIAKKIGINYITGETLWNDLLNLIIGMAYLSEQICSGKNSDIQDNVKHGINCYLGGPDYLRKSASNESTSSYLANYSTTVWQEYIKLTYIYKGIYADNSLKAEIDPEFFKELPDTNFENDSVAVSK